MNATERMAVAVDIIGRLGASRAADGTHLHPPVYPNKTGYHGVDFTGGKFRARIRFSDALSGRDVRITLGRFNNAEDAGYAYKVAHVALWGALSCFVGEVTVEQIEAARAAGIADPTWRARGDSKGLCG